MASDKQQNKLQFELPKRLLAVWHFRNLPLQDAAPRTSTLTPRVVAVGKRDRDTPSGGDYMERKLKA